MLHRRKAIHVLLMVLACFLATLRAGDSPPPIISIPDLNIRYAPPSRMVDKTSTSAMRAREHAASYSARMAQTLLEMSSNDDDTSPDWHQMVLFIFPRAQFSQLDDAAASQKINAAIAGHKASAVGQPQTMQLSGHKFFVSEFTLSEPPLLKHAKIFTILHKGQLVSFAFVSNSMEQLREMEKTLSTAQFSDR